MKVNAKKFKTMLSLIYVCKYDIQFLIKKILSDILLDM